MSLIDDRQEGALITVRRDNVVLDIPADQKNYYMGLGYNVIGKDGSVIEETTPTDIASLQRFYKDAKKKIAELEAEIKTLKAQKREKPVKKEEPILSFDNVEVVEQPTVTQTGRRRRKA